MRVNFAFICLFAGVFFIASSFTERDRDLRAKQVNLIIRQIGHRLLLQAGDPTSRVLPVTETKEGTFLLKFENDFVFCHDSLMALSKRLLPKTHFPSGYTVTVHDCSKGDIVYGFQLNNTSPDILACGGRNQPPGCYTIEFAFPDLYAKANRQETVVDKRPVDLKSVEVDPKEANPKPAELKTTSNDHGIDRRTKDPDSVSVDSREVNPKQAELKSTTLINVVYGGILVLLVAILFIARFSRILKPVAAQNQNHAITKETVPELPALGTFLFNVNGQHLLMGSEVISLTDKECKVLELLHKNFGELVPRETLLQKVWIDEGVMTGRSLDMFVSKLRKKLSPDAELRITNVHGKGYKLEILKDILHDNAAS